MKNLTITLHLKTTQDTYAIALQTRPHDGTSDIIRTAPKKIQAVFAQAEARRVVIKLSDPSLKQAEQMLLELIQEYKANFLYKAVLSGPKSPQEQNNIVTLKEWPKDF